VSLLSNRRVELKINSGGLSAALFSRWPGRKRLAHASVAWNAMAPDSLTAAEPGLAGAVDRLLGELARTASLRGVPLDIELSDALVHLDVAHGDFDDHSEPQLAAVTRACVRDLLGDAVEEHELRWQLQADESHLLMCAAPKPLLATLRGATQRLGLRTNRVATQFQAEWNRHHQLLRSGLGIFACGHDAHIVVAFVRDGVVEALSTSSCQADLEDPNALFPDVDRLLNNLGLENAATPTRLDAQVDRLIASLGVEVRQLERFVAVDGGDNGLALSSRWQFYERSGVVQ
jgi:hypothetical protein